MSKQTTDKQSETQPDPKNAGKPAASEQRFELEPAAVEWDGAVLPLTKIQYAPEPGNARWTAESPRLTNLGLALSFVADGGAVAHDARLHRLRQQTEEHEFARAAAEVERTCDRRSLDRVREELADANREVPVAQARLDEAQARLRRQQLEGADGQEIDDARQALEREQVAHRRTRQRLQTLQGEERTKTADYATAVERVALKVADSTTTALQQELAQLLQQIPRAIQRELNRLAMVHAIFMKGDRRGAAQRLVSKLREREHADATLPPAANPHYLAPYPEIKEVTPGAWRPQPQLGKQLGLTQDTLPGCPTMTKARAAYFVVCVRRLLCAGPYALTITDAILPEIERYDVEQQAQQYVRQQGYEPIAVSVA